MAVRIRKQVDGVTSRKVVPIKVTTNRVTVWCRHEFVGFHLWPKAPSGVGYLGTSHRHLFKVELEVSVTGKDRQVEFHTLKQTLMIVCSRFENKQDTAYSFSCEQIATQIANDPSLGAVVKVIVSEDGECGATVYVDR